MTTERRNPDELFNSIQYGFSQAVTATGTRIVSVSGQVAWDADENLIGGGDLAVQAANAPDNLRAALHSADAGVGDVVSLRNYVVDYDPGEAAAISRALKAFFPAGNEPAATWLGVAALASPDLRVEIEAMAVVADSTD